MVYIKGKVRAIFEMKELTAKKYFFRYIEYAFHSYHTWPSSLLVLLTTFIYDMHTSYFIEEAISEDSSKNKKGKILTLEIEIVAILILQNSPTKCLLPRRPKLKIAVIMCSHSLRIYTYQYVVIRALSFVNLTPLILTKN